MEQSIGDTMTMKLCVIGNGPSAEGRGAEIDACDFVVRIKAWWAHGAIDAGRRCDAHVHYGRGRGDWQARPAFRGEHWFSQTVSQVRQNPEGWDRLSFLARAANLAVVRFVPDVLWDAAFRRLERHPSTGFIAVCMALALKDPNQLLLYGFDSTTPGRPNYVDARGDGPPPSHLEHPPHDQLAEKRAISQLLDGRWLGEPSSVTLTWPDMPDLAMGEEGTSPAMKPCPWCGTSNLIVRPAVYLVGGETKPEEPYPFVVECFGCHEFVGPSSKTQEETIDRWNTRPLEREEDD